MAATLYASQHTFLIISRSFLLGVRNVSVRLCRENQSTYFIFSNFSFENRAVCVIKLKLLWSRTAHKRKRNEAQKTWFACRTTKARTDPHTRPL